MTARTTTSDGFYNRAPFRLDDAERLGEIVDRTVFGTLLSNADPVPAVSHLPFLLDRQRSGADVLRAHLARANDHWRHLDDQPALVMFHGPDHYVTPSWYATKAESGEVVPTWNYVVVHVRGRVHVHHDRDRLRALVTSLTERMESGRERPWQVDDAPEAFVERMLGGIVGIDLTIDQMVGKLKLGQNRPQRDRAALTAGLRRERPELWAALETLGRLPDR